MNRLECILKLLFTALLSALILSGCTEKNPPEEEELGSVEPVEVTTPDPVPDIEGSAPELDYDYIPIVGAAAPGSDSEEFVATLTVTQNMKKRHHGDLIISLGSDSYDPKHDENFVRDTTHFSAEGDTWARVIPHAPDFRIEPEGAKIVKLKHDRTDIRFTLYPKGNGTFPVTADVELFDNPECSGIGDSKSLETLKVRVKVGGWEVVEDGFEDVGGKALKKILNFLNALVVLVLGALFFVIRRYIQKKTGYGGSGDEIDNTENET